MFLTFQQIKDITSSRKIEDSELIKILDSLNQTFEKYGINTDLRIVHFLGQVLHESGTFKYNYEIWGPTKWQKRYEGREDLGNTVPGDGYLFRGRGFIQLTGRTNYTLASKEFNQDFISNPDFVAQYPYNCLVAGWFWKRRNINKYADQDNIKMVTKMINGGYNGLDDRIKKTEKVRKILNT